MQLRAIITAHVRSMSPTITQEVHSVLEPPYSSPPNLKHLSEDRKNLREFFLTSAGLSKRVEELNYLSCRSDSLQCCYRVKCVVQQGIENLMYAVNGCDSTKRLSIMYSIPMPQNLLRTRQDLDVPSQEHDGNLWNLKGNFRGNKCTVQLREETICWVL